MLDLTKNPGIIEPDYEGERVILLIPSISYSDFALKQYQGCTVVGHSREEVEEVGILCDQLQKIIASLQPNYELHKTI